MYFDRNLHGRHDSVAILDSQQVEENFGGALNLGLVCGKSAVASTTAPVRNNELATHESRKDVLLRQFILCSTKHAGHPPTSGNCRETFYT
jgi:hypothetical protein